VGRGVQYGEADLLTSILIAKFKELPNAYLKKIGTADADILKQWAVNVISAESLDEVFK
jgi:hypothetical protein